MTSASTDIAPRSLERRSVMLTRTGGSDVLAVRRAQTVSNFTLRICMGMFCHIAFVLVNASLVL
jgi:hypothetical protein